MKKQTPCACDVSDRPLPSIEKGFGMSDEAGCDRCTALWKTYSVKCTTEEEEETEFEEDRKRGSSGSIRQTYPGHVVRVKMRRETTGPPAKGRQEHLV